MKKILILFAFISFVYADSNKIPNFIKVGNYYEIQFNRVENIKVLKVDDSGWIEVQRFARFRKSPVWLNLSNILSIREIHESEATEQKVKKQISIDGKKKMMEELNNKKY